MDHLRELGTANVDELWARSLADAKGVETIAEVAFLSSVRPILESFSPDASDDGHGGSTANTSPASDGGQTLVTDGPASHATGVLSFDLSEQKVLYSALITLDHCIAVARKAEHQSGLKSAEIEAWPLRYSLLCVAVGLHACATSAGLPALQLRLAIDKTLNSLRTEQPGSKVRSARSKAIAWLESLVIGTTEADKKTAVIWSIRTGDNWSKGYDELQSLIEGQRQTLDLTALRVPGSRLLPKPRPGQDRPIEIFFFECFSDARLLAFKFSIFDPFESLKETTELVFSDMRDLLDPIIAGSLGYVMYSGWQSSLVKFDAERAYLQPKLKPCDAKLRALLSSDRTYARAYGGAIRDPLLVRSHANAEKTNAIPETRAATGRTRKAAGGARFTTGAAKKASATNGAEQTPRERFVIPKAIGALFWLSVAFCLPWRLGKLLSSIGIVITAVITIQRPYDSFWMQLAAQLGWTDTQPRQVQAVAFGNLICVLAWTLILEFIPSPKLARSSIFALLIAMRAVSEPIPAIRRVSQSLWRVKLSIVGYLLIAAAITVIVVGHSLYRWIALILAITLNAQCGTDDKDRALNGKLVWLGIFVDPLVVGRAWWTATELSRKASIGWTLLGTFLIALGSDAHRLKAAKGPNWIIDVLSWQWALMALYNVFLAPISLVTVLSAIALCVKIEAFAF